MKREIKFRAWDSEAEFMAYQDNENHQDYFWWFEKGTVVCSTTGELKGGNAFEPAEIEPIILDNVMQFAGLKDKNGKEIYEGDILLTETGKNMVVGWDKRYASFVVERDGWIFKHYFGEAFEAVECEVIGNIYENPELLNK